MLGISNFTLLDSSKVMGLAINVFVDLLNGPFISSINPHAPEYVTNYWINIIYEWLYEHYRWHLNWYIRHMWIICQILDEI